MHNNKLDSRRRQVLSRALVATTVLALPHAYSQTPAQTFKFDLQGHRGARGLLPENSLPAFERALDLGVDTLELDIGLSKDDVVVIGHDPILNPNLVRGSDGQWVGTTPAERPSIRSLTFTEIQRYDVGRIKPGTPYATTFATQEARDGTRMPSLAALFELVQKQGDTKVRFNIETKLSPLLSEETATPEEMTQALLAVIEKHSMQQRVTVQSFDWRTLIVCQRLAQNIPTVYLTVQQQNFNNIGSAIQGQASPWTAGFAASPGESLSALIKRAGGAVWSPFWRELTPETIASAQSIGLRVIPWTVNEVADMQRLLEWKADGIITDYPDRALPLRRR